MKEDPPRLECLPPPPPLPPRLVLSPTPPSVPIEGQPFLYAARGDTGFDSFWDLSHPGVGFCALCDSSFARDCSCLAALSDQQSCESLGDNLARVSWLEFIYFVHHFFPLLYL